MPDRAKALDQRPRRCRFICLETSLPEQVARDDAVHHLQHGRHQLGLCGQQQAQHDRQRQHPLAHRHVGDDMVHQVRRCLHYSPGNARRTRAAPLAVEADELEHAVHRIDNATPARGKPLWKNSRSSAKYCPPTCTGYSEPM